MAAALGAVVLLVVAVVLVAGGGEDERVPSTVRAPDPTAEPEPTPSATPEPDTKVREPAGRLAIGITEPQPAFVHPGVAAPEPFERWRRSLQRMGPDLYRLVLDWPTLEEDLAAPRGGCMRDVPPCAQYASLQTQLEALAAAQREGGWETMVVVTGTPERYAVRASGCERAGTEPRSRAPNRRGMEAYRAFLRRVQEAADRTGARLRYWSPWNEPNHPYGLSPQRVECRANAPSGVLEPYTAMARIMRDELRDGQELVLGELAGLLQRKSSYNRVQEFIRGLPRDVVCASRVFGQHGYVGGPDPVDEVAASLRRFDCPDTHEIWMTETGAGAPRRGETRGGSARRACRNIRRRLAAWYEDPRVTAAFQYTLREDDRFPTGLVTVGLDRAYPALGEWVAWGRRKAPTAPPPKSRC